MVVLHKGHIDTCADNKVALVEAFKKEATRIAKNLGFKDFDFGQGGRRDGVGRALI